MYTTRITKTYIFFILSILILILMPSILGVKVTRIQLKNGANVSTRVGRIEIQVENINVWGSICDDSFDEKDAIVACRMLGFTNGGRAVLTNIYGEGNYNFLMDDAACTGDEKNLTECTASQTADCSKASGDVEVGVECNENSGGQVTPAPATTTTAGSSIISGKCQQIPTVKLYGKQGVDGMGYVQVQAPNGLWGYVCDDNWNEIAARIVCAQMCYPTNYTAKPGIPAENKLRPQNVSIFLDNVQCTGSEATLQDCQHGDWYSSDCKKDDDELAGVQCVAAAYQPPPAPVPILTCGQGKMIAQFSRVQDPNLEEKHLTILSQANCSDVTKSTTTNYVSINIPVDKCGTTISVWALSGKVARTFIPQSQNLHGTWNGAVFVYAWRNYRYTGGPMFTRNGTHILYFNELKYDYTTQEGAITRVNVYRIDITCALPVNEGVTQRVQSVTAMVTQKAAGSFTASMEIYRNDSFSTAVTENPVVVPLGEWLNMAVVMEQYDPRLMLTVTDCLATPNGNKSGTIRQVLIADKCSQESTLSFYPINNFKFGFRFKPFKFVGYDLLYLHCDAIVCIASDNIKECDRTCNNTKPVNSTTTAGRRRRSGNIFYTSADSFPIVLYNPGFINSDPGTTKPTTKVTDSETKDNNRIIINSATNVEVITTNAPVLQLNQFSSTGEARIDIHFEGNFGHKPYLSLITIVFIIFGSLLMMM